MTKKTLKQNKQKTALTNFGQIKELNLKMDKGAEKDILPERTHNSQAA